MIARVGTDTMSATERSEAAEYELIAEITAMFRYASSSGFGPMSAQVVRTIDLLNDPGPPPPLAELVATHFELAHIVAPATPRGLRIMVPSDNARRGRLQMPFVARRLMLVAALSLLSTLGFALSPEVSHDAGSLFDNSGLPLAVNLAFLVSAATLGAAFHGLFTLSQHLNRATYDPRYDPSYWIRLVLGIMSGVLLATLEIEGLQATERSVLALVGGFSTMLVYRVLQRLVTAIESLVVPPSNGESSVSADHAQPVVAPPRPVAAPPRALAAPAGPALGAAQASPELDATPESEPEVDARPESESKPG